MKKILFCIVAVLCIVSMVSCDKEKYRHSLMIKYPNTGIQFVYADQTNDSVVFTTFDSYEVSPYMPDGGSWLKCVPYEGIPLKAYISNSYYGYYEINLGVEFSPNTTGNCRTGFVSVRSFCDDWQSVCYAAYYQLSWLNVTKPAPLYTYNSDRVATSAVFVDSLKCDTTDYTLKFNVASRWNLTTKNQNNFISYENKSGYIGDNEVKLTFTPNESDKPRTDTLLLTSNDVTTPIVLKQLVKAKK